MVLRLEKNEADICEKIATIRAVNEELNKKEVCFQIYKYNITSYSFNKFNSLF